jgi:hypothetical protein
MARIRWEFRLVACRFPLPENCVKYTKLYNKELADLYRSRSVIRMEKSRRTVKEMGG